MQPLEQILAGNTLRKAGEVMAHGNQCSPAAALIDHDDTTAETPEIDGGSQPGGASANDEAIGMHGIGHRAASPRNFEEDSLNSATWRR